MANDVGINIRAYDNASGVLNQVGGRLGFLSKQGIGLGLSIVGIQMAMQAAMAVMQRMIQYINESVEAFRNFEDGIAKIGTLLENSQLPILEDMKSEIIDLSVTYGKSTADMTASMYQLISAGTSLSDSMMVLTEAAKLSNVGIGSMSDAVHAITGILNSYSLEASKAAMVSEMLNATIRKGKTVLSELAPALGYVSAVAANYGVTIAGLLGAIAQLTKVNIKTNMAARALRMVIANLGSPTDDARQAALELGIAYDDLTLRSRGLSGVLQLIKEGTEGASYKIRDLVGDVQSLNAVMTLAGSEEYIDTIDDIATSIGELDEKMKNLAENPMFKQRQRDALAEAWQIETGEMAEEFDVEMQKIGLSWDRTTAKMVTGQADMRKGAGLGPLGYLIRNTIDEQKELNEKFEELSGEVVGKTLAEEQGAINQQIADNIDTLREGADASMDLVDQITDRIAQYKDEAEDLRESIADLEEIHDLQTALRFIPFALKDAAYTTHIFDESIQALVDSIRIQRDEIQKLNEVNKSYAQGSLANSIRILELQMKADRRRGRSTRAERDELRELETENKKFRLEQMKNQFKISDIKEKGLTKELADLDKIKRSYQVRLMIATDTFESERAALEVQLGNKLELIKQHAANVVEEYKSAYTSYITWMTAMNAASPGVKGKLKETEFGATGGRLDIYALLHGILGMGSNPLLGQGQTGLSYVPKTGVYKLHEGETVKTKGASNLGGGGRVTIDLSGNLNVNLTKNIGAGDDPEAWVAKKISDGIRRGLIKTDIETMYG